MLNEILKLFLFLVVSFITNEYCFYHTMKIYCKKNNGCCDKCDCWSCPRQKYL